MSRSSFIISSMPADVRLVQDKFVSSANIEVVVVCKQCGRSLMYIRNSKEPRLEPCGTPQCISNSVRKIRGLIDLLITRCKSNSLIVQFKVEA